MQEIGPDSSFWLEKESIHIYIVTGIMKPWFQSWALDTIVLQTENIQYECWVWQEYAFLERLG